MDELKPGRVGVLVSTAAAVAELEPGCGGALLSTAAAMAELERLILRWLLRVPSLGATVARRSTQMPRAPPQNLAGTSCRADCSVLPAVRSRRRWSRTGRRVGPMSLRMRKNFLGCGI